MTDNAGSRDASTRAAAWRWLTPMAGLALAAVVALAGCDNAPNHGSASQPATPSATSTPVGAADWACLSGRERRRLFVLRGPGPDRLTALSVGTGRVAVILAHQVSGSLCQWWPYGRTLAAAGLRVVAFDFDGDGASPAGDGNYPGEVVAAAQWARQTGARQIILMC